MTYVLYVPLFCAINVSVCLIGIGRDGGFDNLD